jgi:hypothetical protein
MYIFIHLILPKRLRFGNIIFQNDGVKNGVKTPSKNENLGSWKTRIAIFEDDFVI